ncbi:MAG: hypothetical protein OXD43_10745 [Bacteroidetes bacterium]|nr:hypothetical protein [Bacteroidota bacterium]
MNKILLLTTLILVPSALAQSTVSSTITATVVLEHPPPTCTIESSSSAHFETITRPCPGCPQRVIGIHYAGELSLSGEHVTNWSVTYTIPNALLSSNGSTLPITIENRQHPATSGTAGGLGTTFGAGPWDFEFRAQYPVSNSTLPETYTGEITATATCS